MKQSEFNQLSEKALEQCSEDFNYDLEQLYRKGFEDGYKTANKEKVIDLYRMKNVDFSLIDTDDSRWDEYKQQRIERGFDDSETWSLDASIIRFTLPRLKRFKEITQTYPSSLKSGEEWDKILQTMIDWMENYDEEVIDNSPYKEGKKNFFKYFRDLWS